MRSSPSSALTSVDLPALGRPTMATRIGRLLVVRLDACVLVLRLLVRRPGALRDRLQAERRQHRRPPARRCPRRARPRPRPARRARAGRPRRSRPSPARPSLLLATRMTGRPEARTELANAASAGVTPSRASSTNSTRSALRDRRLALRAHAGGDRAGAASSSPAVSTRVTLVPGQHRPRPRAGRA